MNARDLRAKRAEVLKAALAMVEAAEKEDRDFSPEEETRHSDMLSEAEALLKRAERLESVSGLAGALPQSVAGGQAPAVLKIPRGDNEERAYAHFLRTGDGGGLQQPEIRASNDTTMNITTAADGGYVVPTGHYQGIIAKRDESMLARALGVREIPGQGTSVNVPVDDEDDGEFVATTESNAFDRDAPALGQKTMTLVMYTKKVDLTYQLLEDEDSRLLAFLEDFVGRGLAKTHNSLLLTEVAANGTALKTFASATVIAVDELEAITFNEALGPYLDDTRSAAWVMQRAVHGEIALLDDTSIRRYYENVQGSANGPTLLGFPIKYSAKSGATAASTKSVYFGNWNYVGLREAPGITVLRDPYTRSSYGEVILNYYFRCDYAVLQAEAIGYGVHPSA
jgi:HK97 family phage major capsid protein